MGTNQPRLQNTAPMMESSQAPAAASAPPKKPRTGVADYFAILGVGDKLVWKHTQKQNIYGVTSGEDDEVDDRNTDGDNHDDDVECGANEEEAEDRFLREIVEVAILALDENNHPAATLTMMNADDSFAAVGTSISAASEISGSGGNHPASLHSHVASTDLSEQQANQSHLSAVMTHPNNYNYATASLYLQQHLPPNSPGCSEATGTTITRMSAPPPPRVDSTKHVLASAADQPQCWTAIQKTLPAAAAGYVPIFAMEHNNHHEDEEHEHELGGVVMDDDYANDNSGMFEYHPPRNYNNRHNSPATPRGPLLWNKHQVWDANLSWNFGLRAVIHAHRQKVLKAITVNPTAPSLKGMLHSKLQSKLKQVMWKGGGGSKDGGSHDRDDEHDFFLANQQQKFVLAYRRRHQSSSSSQPLHPSDSYLNNNNNNNNGPNTTEPEITTSVNESTYDNRPAIADLRLFYVRLHRNLLVMLPHRQSRRTNGTTSDDTLSNATSTTCEKKSSGGLSSLLLEGVFQSQARHFSDKNCRSNNNNSNNVGQSLGGRHDTYEEQQQSPSSLVPVEEYLNLPDGFEEWSIPQEYRWIRDPRLAAEDEVQQHYGSTTTTTDNNKNKPPPPPPSQSSASPRVTLLGQQFRTKVLLKNSYSTDLAATADDNKSDSTTGGDGVEVAAMSLSPSQSTVTSNGGGSGEAATNAATEPALPTTTPLETLLPALVTQPPHTVEEEALANFCYVPIVAYRRQRIGDEERYHEDPAIVEMAVSFMDVQGRPVMPGEEDTGLDFDEGDGEEDEGAFSVLGKTPWTVAGRLRASKKPTARRSRRQFGSPIILVRKNRPFGFADAAFATRVLDRFPKRNYKGLPLPQEELPMFCYPTGCRLFRARYSDAPLAQYYGFVVKNERGDSIYVSCVSFMEPLTTRKAEQLARMSEKRRRTSLPHQKFCEKRELQRLRQQNAKMTMMKGVDTASDCSTEADSNFLLTGFDDMTTFENKTICLVSRFPFWTAFRKFLSHLHILSGSVSDIPLERCISHLLLSVPLPRPGGRNVIVPLPTLNTSTEPMMVLTVPPEKDFPLVDLPYHRLVACLEINTIVMIVLGMLALEKKVIVLSKRPSLVLDVYFPGAIFVGIHDDGSSHGLAATVRRDIPEDAIVVDLETGEVESDSNTDRAKVLETSWDILPRAPRVELVKELQALCEDAEIADGQEPLDSQYDPAFEVSLPNAVEDDVVVDDDMGNANKPEPLDDRAFRDAFLRFFCKVLAGYERFLVVPDADFLVSGNEWFDAQGFLASVTSRSSSEQRAPYLGALVSSQLFQSFIQRRTEASDVHCLLFDECMAEYHASPRPYGRLGDDMEKIQEGDDDIPRVVYSLLVDQSAAVAAGYEQQSFVSNKSFDNSEADNSGVVAFNALKASLSFTENSSAYSKYAEAAFNPAGDLVTGPSREFLPIGQRYIYCIDGNPCFPHRFNESLFLPKEPESWLIEMTKTPDPLLARSEKELDEADRRRRLATTSHRGFQKQNRRCLWQLPKLMGSHFLGAWLLCIPAQVAQPGLSHDQQSRYLMRALGALRLLRSKQRIVPDEAAYRALMVACGRSSSDRRTELVKLFGLLRSDGIFPSAVTLGQYTRALAEGYNKQLLGSGGGTSGGGNNYNDDGGDVASDFPVRTGRASIGSVHHRVGLDWDEALNSTDGHLVTLEQHGRRWRNKQHSTEHDDGGKDQDGRKKKSTRASWLPVVYSSSFVPMPMNSDATSPPTRAAAFNENMQTVQLVAMWSKTRDCRNCRYIPLEEEVQAGWDIVGEDDESSGAICCPRCGSLFVPMLGIQEFSLEEAATLGDKNSDTSNPYSFADFDQLPPQICPRLHDDRPTLTSTKVHFVAYKSPAVVRVALEQYVEESGGDDTILAREKLRELDPELFYNFWWYCARFSLPLPLSVVSGPGEHNGTHPAHCIAFAGWDQSVAERACFSAAQVLSPLFNNITATDKPSENLVDPFDEHPLLSRFNLQGFYSNVWDHEELSKILVCLVEACDKRDFKPVVECVLENNQRRKEKYAGSRVVVDSTLSDSRTEGEVELDVYRTILYLAKYQCTTAFHAFFPATIKACKGYHFWCAIGQPLPIFDRLLRDGIQRVAKETRSGLTSSSNNNTNNTTSAGIMKDVSDVALGFRCVFGHLI